jgi:putative transcriptional regulator
MIPFLRFVVSVALLGFAGMLPWSAAAEQPNAPNLGVKMAPDSRPPTYSLARGMFLIASRQLVDPNFSESVVLLLEYDAKGALGLIVNRPTEVQLTDLLPDVDELKERADVVYVGGPVSKDRIVLLMRSEQHPRESGRVFADTYVSSSMETLKHAVTLSREGGTFHAYIGYAGWAPGQLDNEVSRGDWHVSPAEEAMVFDRAAEEIWHELIEKNSGHWVRDSHPRLLVAGGSP